MTKSEVAAVISRIERAPNVSVLMKAVDAALGSNAIGINRVGRQWEVSEAEFAIYAASFATVRRRLASYVEDAHTFDEASEEAAPAMVAQPAQLQQADAGTAAEVTGYVVVKKWMGEDGVLYATRFPVVLPKAADAGGVICMLLSGTSPQYHGFFGPADRERDAILDMEEVRVSASMFPQPIQQAQSCAALAPALSKAGAAKAEVERLEARCAVLRDEKRAAYVLLKECRSERIAAVAGELDACPGVCWTNEERAEAAADEATAALDRCLNDFWEACDYLRDEDREERRATLKARIAQGPAMVMQPVQQTQARDLRRPPVAREIRIEALGHLGHSCDPTSPEASLWIVTDGRLSRDCATHQEALDLAEDFRVWGYVVPAMVPQPVQQQQACGAGPGPFAETAPPVRLDHVAAILDELVQEDADAAEIAAIYAVGPLGGGKFLAPGRDGIDVFDDGDASKPYTTLPRGLPPRTARLLIDYWERGYERGLKNGAAEIQRGMKRLLGVAPL